MELELWQYGRRISRVTLQFFQVVDRKQGYSATVIPGLDHEYKLSMTGGGDVPRDWIIEFSDPVFGNRWKRDEINLVVSGRTCPSPVHSQHDRRSVSLPRSIRSTGLDLSRYIWSGDSYLTVRGRGACTSFPDMPPINCRSQPKLSNIEQCPQKCPNACPNGYCDCATGECLCHPGFSGSNCQRDLCALAGCVHGVCSARYLGGQMPVTNKACVCQEGWYGERCDTRVPPAPAPERQPTCFNGCYFHMDTDIEGGQFSVIQTSDPNACCAACRENPTCDAWVLAVVCFLKTGTQRIHKPGVIAGIKCSAGIPLSTVATTAVTSSVTKQCDGRCHGSFPYGCSSGYPTGYCNAGGGCSYSAINHPDWCCFQGCEKEPTAATVPVTTTLSASPSCDGKCRGQYPYGCNPSFSLGYCNAGGGCSYSSMNDPNWCCFKGC